MLHLAKQLETILPSGLSGSVVYTIGLTAAVEDFPAPVGALVEIESLAGRAIRGEVIGFRDQRTLVYPFECLSGVRRGSRVRLVRTSRTLRVGNALLGRVVDAHGRCLDQFPQPALAHRINRDGSAPAAMERRRIDTVLSTGVRAIDALHTCGRGQRMGIFSGAGIGKSVLLGMMARHTEADVNVIGLIGERGREVSEFIERNLGPQAMAQSVIVVATSDEPAILRVHAAQTATAIAEHFRDQGCNVLLLVDSITRFAMAQREIGLAAGEPPATRGYPPSVFSQLPQLVERAGNSRDGSITAYYSILVEGDDLDEPISDAMRGLLDGHIILSRTLANRGHYPAIDVLESLSRLMSQIVSKEQLTAATLLRELLGAHRDHKDLISIGAYRAGSNRHVDVAIAMLPEIVRFLQQTPDQANSFEMSRNEMMRLSTRCAGQFKDTAVSPTPEGVT